MTNQINEVFGMSDSMIQNVQYIYRRRSKEVLLIEKIKKSDNNSLFFFASIQKIIEYLIPLNPIL